MRRESDADAGLVQHTERVDPQRSAPRSLVRLTRAKLNPRGYRTASLSAWRVASRTSLVSRPGRCRCASVCVDPLSVPPTSLCLRPGRWGWRGGPDGGCLLRPASGLVRRSSRVLGLEVRADGRGPPHRPPGEEARRDGRPYRAPGDWSIHGVGVAVARRAGTLDLVQRWALLPRRPESQGRSVAGDGPGRSRGDDRLNQSRSEDHQAVPQPDERPYPPDLPPRPLPPVAPLHDRRHDERLALSPERPLWETAALCRSR